MSDDVSTLEETLTPAEQQVEWIPENYFARITWDQIFPRVAPLDLDIGAGEGAFLLEMARRHPERNFLAIERLLGRVGKICRGALRGGLTNVRVLRLEGAYAMKHLFPLETVALAYVSFPDPWPKRHHHPRRIIQDDFLQDLRAVLEPGGEVRLKTDDLPYFTWMEKVAARAPGYERVEWPEDLDYPITNFERRFLAQGMPIHKLMLRKV